MSSFDYFDLKVMCYQRNLLAYGSVERLTRRLEFESEKTKTNCFTFLPPLDPRPKPHIQQNIIDEHAMFIGGIRIFKLSSTSFIESSILIHRFCANKEEIEECARLLGAWYENQGKQMIEEIHPEFFDPKN